MKYIIYIFLLITGFILFTGQKNKDNQRRLNINPWVTVMYPSGKYNKLPEIRIEYVPPSTSSRIYTTPSEVLVVSPNIRVFPSLDDQTETIITRQPLNENIMFGSANTSLNSPYFASQGVYVTTDGGSTWPIARDKLWPDQPQNLLLGDPAPVIDKNGVFIITYLWIITSQEAIMCAARSTNNGLNFSANYVIPAGGRNRQDKNMSNTDDYSSSQFYGRSYTAWSDFDIPHGIWFSYTTDGGSSWTNAISINAPPLYHYSHGVDVAVGLNGHVYLLWADVSTELLNQYEDYMGFAKSTNGGVNWTINENIFDSNGMRGYLSKKHNIRVNGFPRIDVDKSTGPRNGYLYVVYPQWHTPPPYNEETDNPDIYLRYSSDEGNSWSNALLVNQDNNNAYQWFPAVRIDEFGNINVVYYDDREVGSDKAEVYVSRSTDGGNTWTDIKVSDVSFTPLPVGYLSDPYMGDYIGITSGKGKVWPFWMDNRIVQNNIYLYQAWTTSIDVICPTDVALQNTIIQSGQMKFYCASNSITAGNPYSFNIQSGGGAIFQAGNYVELDPGFTAESNSYFNAYIYSSDNKNPINANSIAKINKGDKSSKKLNELIPSEFSLSQNYPNPFNSSTIIQYALKNDVNVTIKIYDILGREVRTLVNEFQKAGYKSIDWDGRNDKGIFVSSGLYLYKLIAGDYTNTKKLVIIK